MFADKMMWSAIVKNLRVLPYILENCRHRANDIEEIRQKRTERTCYCIKKESCVPIADKKIYKIVMITIIDK